MYEALKNTDCQQILFMDDDIRIEPDSILRALAMNRFAKTPTLVGGQMLNLQDPAHLHVMGEVVGRGDFMWTNAPHTKYDHDFARNPLNDRYSDSKLLHRRIDVDYNGWWMCMIPRAVADELGQPLPLFIKWDDADYGLRAAEHGYPTVTMPGTAIWHMAWSDKDDAIDWQAYFHLRNRLVVAALHWDGDVRGLVRSHLKATLKHLLCLEYSTVAIQNKAMDDFLAGPEHIFSILESALPEVHRLRRDYPDAVILPSATQLPPPSGMVGRVGEPRTPPGKALRLLRGVLHNFTRADAAHHERPQLNVPTQDSRWFLLCTVDGVTVTTADSRGVVYRQRDRAKMFALLRASLRRQRKLARRFDEMRKAYRDALPVLSSKQQWETVFPENARAWMTRCAARTPRWWLCSRRWPTGPACSRVRAPSRISASTASDGLPSPRSARCCSHGSDGPGWPPESVRSLAHAAAVVIKRLVRRERPNHPSVVVNVGTPSRLSFPSAHATSTTAASILMARASGLPLPALLVPPMALSRLVLGVHYPSDVITGVAVGAAVAKAVGKIADRAEGGS